VPDQRTRRWFKQPCPGVGLPDLLNQLDC
jgi:hypothetical protein